MSYSGNFTNRNSIFDSGDSIDGDHVKALYDELGSDPSGASADLTARLTAIEAGQVSAEFIRDTMATALQAGSGVTITPDDGGDIITITSSTLGEEEVRDTVADFVVAGSNMTITHDDSANTLTFSSSGGSGGAAEVGFAIPVAASDAPTYQRNWAANIATELGIASLVCDGTADDIQIQAAIDAAEDLVSAGFGAHVILSSGHFYLANDASIIHHPRVKVSGQGVGNTFIEPDSQSGWTAITMGGFTTGRPLWDMYLETPSSSGGGTSELSHLTINGEGYTTESGRITGLRVHHQTNNGSTHPVVGPDAFHTVHHIAVCDVTDVGIWIPGGETGLSGGSADTQACHFHNIRVFHTGSHGIIAGGADNLFHHIDVGSTGNKTLGSPEAAYGYWIDGGNHHFTACKAWYNRRAGVAGTSLSGVGWYINNTRVQMDACETQEAFNHGFYFRNARGTFNSLMAHSCGTDSANSTTGRSSNDCAGFYLQSGCRSMILTGYAFNQSPASTNGITYGLYNEGGVPNSYIMVAWYSESSSGSPAPTNKGGAAFGSTTLYWIGGDTTSGATTTTNIGGSSGATSITKYRTTAATAVTGTTATADSSLTATLTTSAAARWFRYEALVIYNGDTTTDARIGVRLTPTGSSATTELNSQFEYINNSGSPDTDYDYETQTGTAAITHVVGAEAGGAGGANRRSVLIKGMAYVGAAITSAALAVVCSEDGGTGTGVIINQPSYLFVEAVNGGTVS